jgi:transcriptional regulator with XRE-family HTH domain
MNVARGTGDRRAAVCSIATNVFDAREAAGVTRKAMARALGVTSSTLWRKETGGTEFKASELVTIATACGVDVGRLLLVAVEAAAVK